MVYTCQKPINAWLEGNEQPIEHVHNITLFVFSCFYVYLKDTSRIGCQHFGPEAPQQLEVLLVCTFQLILCTSSPFPNITVLKLDIVLLLQTFSQLFCTHSGILLKCSHPFISKPISICYSFAAISAPTSMAKGKFLYLQ